MSKRFVERRGYLAQLDAFRDNTDFVKVITGVRRCGKSTLMTQFIRRLEQGGVPSEKIFRFNLEDPEYFEIRQAEDLKNEVFAKIPRSDRCYVFLDEIQRAEGWERVVNALMSGTDADIYITGSNAHLLSSELTTYLTGRYVSIKMLPLSFGEWQELYGAELDDAGAIRAYMAYGGFPAVDPALGNESIRTILRDLYASIVKWDVATRGQIRNMGELDRLMVYMMHNIGNPLSLNNIVEGLQAGRELVERYLNLMEEAFILYRADRFDIASKALSPAHKYYAVDLGLREMAVGFTQKDPGRVLENIIYLELLRRSYTVQIGKYDVREVDFVATPLTGGREYYQVCLTMLDEKTAERELSVLRAIKDNFPKTILTLDPVVRYLTEDGIAVMYVVDWLLGRN